jgi:hypothetical protein
VLARRGGSDAFGSVSTKPVADLGDDLPRPHKRSNGLTPSRPTLWATACADGAIELAFPRAEDLE